MTKTPVTLQIPPDLGWMVDYYKRKAKIRCRIPSQSLPDEAAFERELIIALEQYAIQGIETNPDFKGLE